jgi:DDE superfamily endonuclease
MYYNGWQHGHYVTNLLVFASDGRIIKAVLNAPGSVHDSTVAEWGDVYDSLGSVYERTGANCCLDSAFASNDAPYLIRSAQDYTKAKTPEELCMLTPFSPIGHGMAPVLSRDRPHNTML